MKGKKNCVTDNVALTGMLITRLLLSIICLVHLFVLTTYLLRGEIPAYLFPLSVLIAVGLNLLLTGKWGITRKVLLMTTLYSVMLVGISLLVSWMYFDFSWDGQWYQQAAVYDLAGHWDPVHKPLETPGNINHPSILHFPKSVWYFGAAVFKLFGTVEMGKACNWIVLFATFGPVYALCREFKISARLSTIFTVLVLLNPVVWSELTTYLNDGDLYLLLVIYLASVILWLRNPGPAYMLQCIMAVICLVNTKFTGLVFFLVTSFFVFVYILIRQRASIRSFLLSHLAAGALAVSVFGFNPYITNMLYRGSLLYPLMGTQKFPGVFANGSDDNETYETPHNMQGKSLIVRLLYANFSRPGNAPYNGEDSARLAFPLKTDIASWQAYDYHETRLGGFGPYFGILLLLTLVSLPALLIVVKSFRVPALVFFPGLCCCLSLSRHFWWPRFFPMLWLLPMLVLFLLWIGPVNPGTYKMKRWLKGVTIYSWLLAVIIGGNGLIVAMIHMRWETVSSLTLRSQLEQMRDEKRHVTVDYGYFKRSVEEKLDRWGIRYTAGGLRVSEPGTRKLTSVVEGYPNQVLYRQD